MQKVLLAAAALAVATVAWSQTDSSTILPPSNSGLAESFRKADVNGDGALSIEEARQAGFGLSETFAAVDTDGSGTVTLFEIGEALHRKMSEWANADADGDGEVTEDEAKKGSTAILNAFLKADANTDHQVSREEYQSYSVRQMYRNVEMPSVYPNIIDKKF